MDNISTIITKDGSSSLYSPYFNEIYHSRNGAIEEAKYVYIDKALYDFIQKNNSLKQIKLFEIGFGTGLNAWLAAIFALENNITINYTGIEKYPLNHSLLCELNFATFFPEYKAYLTTIQNAAWNQSKAIHSYFICHKLNADIFEYSPEIEQYSVIFFDAFAPTHQPEIWSKSIFEKIYQMMHKNGILTTYCAKSTVRNTMIAVGFNIEKLPGPPGKREMLRATKN